VRRAGNLGNMATLGQQFGGCHSGCDHIEVSACRFVKPRLRCGPLAATMPRVMIAMPAWWLGYRDLATLENEASTPDGVPRDAMPARRPERRDNRKRSRAQ